MTAPEDQGDRMASQMAQAMSTMLVAFAPLLEALAGYRAQAEAAGFCHAAAEEMAVALHEGLVRQAFRQTTA
jgi:hypothetical protein